MGAEVWEQNTKLERGLARTNGHELRTAMNSDPTLGDQK